MESGKDNINVITLDVTSGSWRKTNDLLCPTQDCKSFSKVLSYEPVIWRYHRYEREGVLILAEVYAHHCEDCGLTGYEVDVDDEINVKLSEALLNLGLQKPKQIS